MKLSDAEWQLMNALWQDHPATARELIERLPKDINWAYTTVKTMLTRLVGKNAVKETKRGNTGFYEPLITQENAHKKAVSNLFEKVLNGTVEPIMHFLTDEKKLSDKERKELIRILQEADQKGGKHGTDQQP